MLKSLINLAAVGCILAFSSPVAASAQDDCPVEECYTEQQAREDFVALYEGMQAEAIGLYARTSKTVFDAKHAEMLARIDGPVAKTEFHRMLQEFMAVGKIGHLKTDAPVGDVIAKVRAGEAIIPLSITYRDGVMVTDQWANETDDMPPGSRITRIGDYSVDEFEAFAQTMMSADTERLFRAQLELLIPAYLHMAFGAPEMIDVGFVRPDGTVGQTPIASLPLGDMYALHERRPVAAPSRDPSARIHKDLGDGIYYLQPGPFFAFPSEQGEGGETYTIEAFASFVEGAFGSMATTGATDLIIDIRNNPGGDASFSDLIMSRITDEPYRLSSRYQVRAGANTKQSWADWEIDGNSLGDQIAEALKSADTGSVVEIALAEVQPAEQGGFSGRVWVLIDRLSFSNAAVVAATMQDYDMATLLGEATADLATTYGATESFTLPHSGAAIVYPKSYLVRPSGDEAVQGVTPDIAIAPHPVGSGQDTMLDAAVERILATR